MERLGRMKLNLEAVVEDASNEVYSFQIQISYILEVCWVVHYWITSQYTSAESHCIRNPSQGGIISVKFYHAQPCLGISSKAFIYIFKSGYTL